MGKTRRNCPGSVLRENKAQHERGCLLMNTNLSRAVDDVEIKAFLRDNQKQVEEIFVAAFVGTASHLVNARFLQGAAA